MKKRLMRKSFKTSADLVIFVEENNIAQSDVQSIILDATAKWFLFYWSN